MYINQLSKREQEVAEKYIMKAIDHLEGKEAEAAFTDAMNSRLEDLADFPALKKALKRARLDALESAHAHLREAWLELYQIANNDYEYDSPYYQARMEMNSLDLRIHDLIENEKGEQK